MVSEEEFTSVDLYLLCCYGQVPSPLNLKWLADAPRPFCPAPSLPSYQEFWFIYGLEIKYLDHSHFSNCLICATGTLTLLV